MPANIVEKLSLLQVPATVMKEFTLERSRIHVSIAQKLLPLPVPVTVMKKLTLQRSILRVTFVGKPSTVRVPITLIKKIHSMKEKLYVCKHCGKEFTYCGNFLKHERIHTIETLSM